MGITYVRGKVSSNGHQAELDFLVDSGTLYTLLPYKTWRAMKLKRKRTETYTLADGTKTDRDVSECHIAIAGLGEGHTPVILGERGDEALLGVITLEEMGLVLNPFSRKLQPMRLMMA